MSEVQTPEIQVIINIDGYTEPLFVSKRELFDEEMYMTIVQDENFCKKDRDYLKRYFKERRESGGVATVVYQFGKGCDVVRLGRLFPTLGLGTMRFDIRNVLTALKYWDIDFENSSNVAIYADILIGKDTVRVYNIHLQSISISRDIHEEVDQSKSEIIFYRISKAFKKQQLQAELIKEHKKQCAFPIIICGDMNNSAFSYVYRSVRGSLLDGFEEKGSGLGSTYPYKYYPARIDYIFADKRLKIKSFENFTGFVNSDHLPIMSRLSFEAELN